MDIKFKRMLLGDWFRRLALEAGLPLNSYGSSGQAFNYRSSNNFYVTAEFIEQFPFLKFVSSETEKQGLVEEIANAAVHKLEKGDFGGTTWYTTTLTTSSFGFLKTHFMSSFLQHLSAQKRILGWRRLGKDILLEFTEDIPDKSEQKNQLIAPKSFIHIHLAIISPCAGHFSSYVSHVLLELVSAICTFALGREISPSHAIFPSEENRLEDLNSLHFDQKILTLARKGVGLDIFSIATIPGGINVFSLLRSAFLSFNAALKQDHDAVACILFVVAAEALTVPNQKWKSEKLTKRFVEFYNTLIPESLDRIVAHGNFEDIFKIKRGTKSPIALRKKLLNKIYSYRSGNLHEGLKPSSTALGINIDTYEVVRRGIFLDFSEACILEFIKSPRVSLIGHPDFTWENI